MFGGFSQTQRFQVIHNSRDVDHGAVNYVTLADGSTMAVRSTSLVAAKAYLAAKKAADRQVACDLASTSTDLRSFSPDEQDLLEAVGE